MTAIIANIADHVDQRRPVTIRRRRPRAKLEECEQAALRDLGRYVILNEETFGISSGYGRTMSFSGLAGLHDKGLVDRGWYKEPRTAEEVAMSSKPKVKGLAYKLTRAGLKRGINEGLIDEGAMFISGSWNGEAPKDMMHRVLVVELMIRLRLELAAHDRLCVGRLTPDFVRKNKRSINFSPIDDKRFLITDLIAGIEDQMGGFPALAFFEIEQTRLQPSSRCPSKATVATKIKPYSELLVSKHRKINGADQDLLLYVQNQTAEHLDEIIKNVPWDEVGAARNVVRFTTFDEVRQHGVLSGRWRNHAGDIVPLVR